MARLMKTRRRKSNLSFVDGGMTTDEHLLRRRMTQPIRAQNACSIYHLQKESLDETYAAFGFSDNLF